MHGFYRQALQKPFIQTQSTLKSPLFTCLDLYVFNKRVLYPSLSAFLGNSVQFAMTNLFLTALNSRWKKKTTSTRTRSFVNHVRKNMLGHAPLHKPFLDIPGLAKCVSTRDQPGDFIVPAALPPLSICIAESNTGRELNELFGWWQKDQNIQLCKSEVKATRAVRPHQNDFSSLSTRSRLPSILACW